jgi:PPOX class probable F420-dependent enzyme
MNNKFASFAKQKYLCIETFRKNGQSVKTPVWFAQDGDTLHIWTSADSGKVKRARRDVSVRIAPSDVGGNPLGDWIPARAQADDSLEAVQTVNQLMAKKYGLSFRIFDFLNRKSKSIDLKIVAE